MHFVLSGNSHSAFSFSKDQNGQGTSHLVALPCSDYMVCVDPTYQRLYLMQRRGMGREDIPSITPDDILEDLVVSYISLGSRLDEVKAVCGGLCSDASGYRVYVLMIAPPQAYVKVVEVHGEVLVDTGLRLPVPSSSTWTVVNSAQDTITSIASLETHLGEVTTVNQYLTGSGIVCNMNTLYVLTRRTAPLISTVDFNEAILYLKKRTKVGVPVILFESGATEWVKTDAYTALVVQPVDAETGNEIQFEDIGLYTVKVEVKGAEIYGSTVQIRCGDVVYHQEYVGANSPARVISVSNIKVSGATPATISITSNRINYFGCLVRNVQLWLTPDTDIVGHITQQVRVSEIRTADVQYSVLSKIAVDTGEHLGSYTMSLPTLGVAGDTSRDCILHGLALHDNTLVFGKRLDTYRLSNNGLQWHLRSHITHWGDENKGIQDPFMQPVGILKWEEASTLEGQPPAALLGTQDGTDTPWYKRPTAEIYAAFPQIFKSTNAASTAATLAWLQTLLLSKDYRLLQQPVVQQNRGGACLAIADCSAFTGAMHYVGISAFHSIFPFDVVLPSSMSIDTGDCKLFVIIGDRIWTFDILHCSILVNYGTSLFTGDIVDFGDVKDAEPHELQCFLRNDATYPLYNVQLNIGLKDDDPRRSDVFLAIPPATQGYKSILLGDIVAGGSKEFVVRVYAMDVQEYEDQQTFRVPLRISYNLSDI